MGGAVREFGKGHGTANDFVLVMDPDGELTVTAQEVIRLCDRHRGIGADGLIRVVRSANVQDGRALADHAEWFMDYRNADGSVAQMCGNGVRVFVEYLVRRGLVDAPGPGEGLPVATRGGVKRVHQRADGWYAVDMGPWRLVAGAAGVRSGGDATVRFDHAQSDVPGLSVDLGNPHTVVVMPDETTLDELGFRDPPAVTPTPPHGTNVEAIVVEAPSGDVGRLRMRVFERGVGETLSCGTGACAAVLAARAWAGPNSPISWLVRLPGGEVGVRLLPSGNVELAGPAQIVFDGVLSDTGTGRERLARRAETSDDQIDSVTDP